MYATQAVIAIFGLSVQQLLHKSFYECIQEASLAEAVTSIENAKVNDSMAYLRFWSRDPRSATPSDQSLPQAGDSPISSVEMEAVISCTSDGLMAVVRRARPVSTDPDIILPVQIT